MRPKPIVFFSIVGLIVGVLVYKQANAPDLTLVGSRAPDFEVLDQNGETFRLSDHRGKLVFLNFWATWCEPCIVEMPDMMELARHFEGRPFQMIAVSIDTRWEDIREFYEEHGLDIPTALDPGRNVYDRYNALGVPETFFIDGDGNIIEKFISYRQWMQPQHLSRIEALVAEHERALLSRSASGNAP